MMMKVEVGDNAIQHVRLPILIHEPAPEMEIRARLLAIASECGVYIFDTETDERVFQCDRKGRPE
jgi:hypothetical protein